jgi:hypothetical protein
MNEQKQTDLERARTWLSGDVRVSRKALVLGGVIMLVLLGVALD